MAAVFGVWDLNELSRDILADYFLNYVENIEEQSKDNARSSFIDGLDNLLGMVKSGYDVAKFKFVKDIKNLISVINGYETTIQEISVQYVKIVKELVEIYPDAGIMRVSTTKTTTFSANLVTKNSPLKTFDTVELGASIVFNALDALVDITDTIYTISVVNANTEAFNENIDYLREMYNNGNRKLITTAAGDIMNILAEGYGTTLAKAVGTDLGEFGLNVAISIAGCNPYVGAVLFVRDTIGFITGIKDVLMYEYQMLTYNCMSHSAKNLVEANKHSDGSYYDRYGNLTRMLTHLARIRIMGEKKYAQFYNTGANKWFNDEQQITQNVNLSISIIKDKASDLNLLLNANLTKPV